MDIDTLVLDLSEFYALKVLMENEANCLLEVEAENVTDTFLEGRGKLIEKGFLELDFDGTLKQEKAFARFIYPVRKAATSILLKTDDWYIQYLRTPLGFYSVKCEDKKYVIKKEPKSPIFEWLKDEVLKLDKGNLITRDRKDEKKFNMSDYVGKTDEKKEMLAEHIVKFFGMEKENG